jgi:hypothetical protein
VSDEAGEVSEVSSPSPFRSAPRRSKIRESGSSKGPVINAGTTATDMIVAGTLQCAGHKQPRTGSHFTRISARPPEAPCRYCLRPS